MQILPYQQGQVQGAESECSTSIRLLQVARIPTTIFASILRVLRIPILVVPDMLDLVHAVGVSEVASIRVMALSKVPLESALMA